MTYFMVWVVFAAILIIKYKTTMFFLVTQVFGNDSLIPTKWLKMSYYQHIYPKLLFTTVIVELIEFSYILLKSRPLIANLSSSISFMELF